MALGASRWRLVRQLLVESVLLGVVASAAGLLVATWASPMLVRQLSTQNVPIVLDLSFDWRLILFAIAVATTAVLIVGVVPALRASAVAPIDALKEQGRGATGATGGTRARRPRHRADRVVCRPRRRRRTVRAHVRVAGDARSRVRTRPRARRAARQPDARSQIPCSGSPPTNACARPCASCRASRTRHSPLSRLSVISSSTHRSTSRVAGRCRSASGSVYGNMISPGWFNTFGVPLIAGRDLTEGDRGAPSWWRS